MGMNEEVGSVVEASVWSLFSESFDVFSVVLLIRSWGRRVRTRGLLGRRVLRRSMLGRMVNPRCAKRRRSRRAMRAAGGRGRWICFA